MSKRDAIPNHTVVAAWARLVRAQRSVLDGVERALRANGFPPLAWYDVLLELERAPAGLRLRELEARMLLAQYHVSRLADRIAASGLAVKRADPQDARGRVLAITAAGRAMRKAMWPSYAAAIQRQLGNRLSDDEAAVLAGLLGRLTDRDDGTA